MFSVDLEQLFYFANNWFLERNFNVSASFEKLQLTFFTNFQKIPSIGPV